MQYWKQPVSPFYIEQQIGIPQFRSAQHGSQRKRGLVAVASDPYIVLEIIHQQPDRLQPGLDIPVVAHINVRKGAHLTEVCEATLTGTGWLIDGEIHRHTQGSGQCRRIQIHDNAVVPVALHRPLERIGDFYRIAAKLLHGVARFA